MRSRLTDLKFSQRPCFARQICPHSNYCSDRRSYATSSLYIPHGDESNTTVVQVDPDFDRIFSDVQSLKSNLEKRNITGVDLDILVENYTCMMNLFKRRIELLEKRDKLNTQMKQLVKNKKDPSFKEKKSVIVAEASIVKEDLKSTISQLWPMEENVVVETIKLPNFIAPETPDHDVIMDSFGQPLSTESQINHVDQAHQDKTLQMSNVSPGSYYLLGSLSEAELTVTEEMSNLLHDRGFRQYHPPDFVKRVILEGYGENFDDPEKYFTLRPKDTGELADEKVDTSLHLTGGASYASWIAFFTKMTLQKSDLPLRAFSCGRFYRPMLQASGGSLNDAPQSNQISIFSLCQCEESSKKVASDYVVLVKEIYSSLHVPYRTVQVSVDKLRNCEMSRIEVQAWLPSLGEYITVAEVGVCGDFVSRRLAVKWTDDLQALTREVEESNRQYVHMVHGTVINSTKLLAVLIENNRSSTSEAEGKGINYKQITDRLHAITS